MDEVPTKLTELIVGQAEDNPYYMEELVRRLVDDGVIAVDSSVASTHDLPRWTLRKERLQNLRLPTTLVGLLQARLDALPAGGRLAARQASVIGHVFWGDALQAVDAKAPQALPALQRAAFVRANETSDFEGTTERQFDHHLLHQVTYDTLLKAERRLGHGAAARWLTARTKGRGAEFLAMTGEHAERAGETALAIDCFDNAAAEAKRRFANTAAVSWLRRALALLGESSSARRLDLLHRLQTTSNTMGDRSAQDAAHQEMAALLERHPDDARRARFLASLALLAVGPAPPSVSRLHSRRGPVCGLSCGEGRAESPSRCARHAGGLGREGRKGCGRSRCFPTVASDCSGACCGAAWLCASSRQHNASPCSGCRWVAVDSMSSHRPDPSPEAVARD